MDPVAEILHGDEDTILEHGIPLAAGSLNARQHAL